MNALSKWFKEKGSAGRKALFNAIKAEYPRFSQSSLSQYSLDQRTARREVAEIISQVTGIPLAAIPHRYVHKPQAAERGEAQ